MTWLRGEHPGLYLTSSQSIRKTLSYELYSPPQSDYTDFLVDHIDFTVEENRSRTHIFVGPTGTGKTQFALSHFSRAVLVSDRQDLCKIDERTDGIVFDDMQFSDWKTVNILHLVDCYEPRTVNVKYSAAEILRFLPRIFCTNDLSLIFPCNMLLTTREAIERRCKIYDVVDNLYVADNYDHLKVIRGVLKLKAPKEDVALTNVVNDVIDFYEEVIDNHNDDLAVAKILTSDLNKPIVGRGLQYDPTPRQFNQYGVSTSADLDEEVFS